MLIKFIAIFLTFFLTTAMHTRSNFYKISSESIISRNTTIEVCDNGAEPPYCCKNSAKNPDCCTNDGFGKFCCPNGSNNIFCCDDDNDNPNYGGANMLKAQDHLIAAQTQLDIISAFFDSEEQVNINELITDEDTTPQIEEIEEEHDNIDFSSVLNIEKE
ncbi:hypothetical protein PVAND_014383 [Polypedilum vanderplanki]|uniref:Uncharacterized protein n=1 Tax=Polypedilum vanderplanki TaxID=319348 RepID=A0A9J6B9H9_POLVA|nr:hypothetical protein PVAND_014383 [Polypedilum vanderplanki]